MTSHSYKVTGQISQVKHSDRTQTKVCRASAPLLLERDLLAQKCGFEEPTQPQRPPREKKIEGRKPGVMCPKAVNKKEWETINSDLTQILEQQVGTAVEA